MGGNLAAGDFGKDIEGLVKIIAEEVSTKMLSHSVEYTLDATVGSQQGIVMAGIGDNDI